MRVLLACINADNDVTMHIHATGPYTIPIEHPDLWVVS